MMMLDRPYHLTLDKSSIHDYHPTKRGVFNPQSDYIFDLLQLNPTTIAVSSSTHEIKLFDRTSLLATSTLKFHKDTVTKLKILPGENGNLFGSSSRDGSIALWDSRISSSPVRVWQDPGCQFHSFDFDPTGTLLVGGTGLIESTMEAKILFWDIRSDPGLLRQFTDSHNNDITTLQFHPHRSDRLLSGGMDGLVCTFQLDQLEEEDALDKVINIGASVSQAGYFGTGADFIYTMSHMETFGLWTHEGDVVHDFGNMKSASIGGFISDYGIATHFDSITGRLFYYAGSYTGDIGIYLVTGDGTLKLHDLLRNGHNDVVRSILYEPDTRTYLSGAEDGKLVHWSRHLPTSPTTPSSSISSSTTTTIGSSHHGPYRHHRQGTDHNSRRYNPY